MKEKQLSDTKRFLLTSDHLLHHTDFRTSAILDKRHKEMAKKRWS